MRKRQNDSPPTHPTHSTPTRPPAFTLAPTPTPTLAPTSTLTLATLVRVRDFQADPDLRFVAAHRVG